MDPGPTADDEREHNYHYELNGVPMSALELHMRLLANDWRGVDVVPSEAANDWDPASNPEAMKRYLYSARHHPAGRHR